MGKQIRDTGAVGDVNSSLQYEYNNSFPIPYICKFYVIPLSPSKNKISIFLLYPLSTSSQKSRLFEREFIYLLDWMKSELLVTLSNGNNIARDG